MRKMILPLAAVMALGFGVRFAHADDAKSEGGKEEKITGVLIDDHCAGKFEGKGEKAAAGHPASCVVKCVKGGADLVLLSGDKTLKLDKKGEELAKEYIAKADAKTKVTITGTKEGDEIKVASIDAAGSDEKSEKSEKSEK